MDICLLLKTITRFLSDDLLKATELRNKQKNQNAFLLLFFLLPCEHQMSEEHRLGLESIAFSVSESRKTHQPNWLPRTSFHTHPRGSSESRFLHKIGNQICNKQTRMREKKPEAGRERGREGQRGRKGKSWKVSLAKEVSVAWELLGGEGGRWRIHSPAVVSLELFTGEGPQGASVTQSRLARASQTLTDWPSTIPTPSLWEPGVRTAVFNQEIGDDKRGVSEEARNVPQDPATDNHCCHPRLKGSVPFGARDIGKSQVSYKRQQFSGLSHLASSLSRPRW